MKKHKASAIKCLSWFNIGKYKTLVNYFLMLDVKGVRTSEFLVQKQVSIENIHTPFKTNGFRSFF